MLSLHIESIQVDETVIGTDIHLDFEAGKTYCILGHNGSGKSSLAFALMGHPRYTLTGTIIKDGKDLALTSVDERVRAGLFLSFQNIPELPGIRVMEYLRTIYNRAITAKNPEIKPVSSFIFKRLVEKMSGDLGIDNAFFDRDLYVGFSGGEKRKLELLQIRLLDPEYIFLDEIDAGLDIDALKLLAREVERLESLGKTVVMITHNFHLLDTIEPDTVCIMRQGRLIRTGGRELIEQIRTNWFDTLV